MNPRIDRLTRPKKFQNIKNGGSWYGWALSRPFFLYFAVSFVAFAPCLLTGRAFFANDLLYFYGPMRAFLRDQLAQGHFPLWNPYLFCGQPFFADPNSMMAYPPTYLTLFFPVSWGLTLFFLLQMFLAACGMDFWLKSLGFAVEKCRVGSLLYALSAFFWVELIHPPAVAAFACLPWVFGCLENLSKDLEDGKAFAVGLSFAFLFLAGFFQVTLGGIYGGLLYFLARVRPQNYGGPSWGGLFRSRSFIKKLAKASLFLMGGALPLFLQLIPSMEFVCYSSRNSDQMRYENFNSLFSLQPKSVYQFLFPAMGLPPGGSLEEAIQRIRGIGDVDFLGNLGYLGIWFPLLFLLAFRRKGKTIVLFFSSLALLSLMVSFGKYFFLHRLFCGLLPGFGWLRAPYRFIYLYVLCAGPLALWGYQELERIILRKKESPFLLKCLFIYGLGSLLISMVGWRNFGQGVWRETLSAFLGLVGLLWGSQGRWKKRGEISFQAALLLPLLFYGWSCWTAGDGTNYDFRNNSVACKLPRLRLGRVMISPGVPYFLRMNGQAFSTNFPDNSLTPLGIRSIGGYNPLVLKKTDELSGLPLSSKRRLLGLGEILSEKAVEGTSGMKHEIHGAFHFYISPTSPDYLFAPSLLKILPNPRDQWMSMKDPGFDPGELALLDRPLPREVEVQLTGKKNRMHYEIEKDDTDSQIFKVQVDMSSLVVFSEIMYPGWKAFLDGKGADIFTADHAFRALFVPAGIHQVEFKFIPFWAQPLLWLVVLWIFSVILYGSFLLISRRNTALAYPQWIKKSGLQRPL